MKVWRPRAGSNLSVKSPGARDAHPKLPVARSSRCRGAQWWPLPAQRMSHLIRQLVPVMGGPRNGKGCFNAIWATSCWIAISVETHLRLSGQKLENLSHSVNIFLPNTYDNSFTITKDNVWYDMILNFFVWSYWHLFLLRWNKLYGEIDGNRAKENKQSNQSSLTFKRSPPQKKKILMLYFLLLERPLLLSGTLFLH